MVGMEKAAPHAELTAVALEYGTYSLEEVLNALRADNWVHRHGDPDSKKGRAIKEEIREAFYPAKHDWKDLVWERAVETQLKALKGLDGS